MSSRDELRLAQEALVAALVAGAALPAGFDAVRVGAAARALLRKRSGEVARSWPGLALSYGPEWPKVFAGWASDRPTRGSWLDGWDFARAHREALPADALVELALCEARWSYRQDGEPVRRLIAVRRMPGGGVAVQAAGRIRIMRTGRR